MSTTIERTPLARATGWAMWRDGRPASFGLCETKESLLIGYDMIPLRGLDATERHLAGRGMVAHLTNVEVAADGRHHCYAVTVRGELLPEMLEYSVCSDTPAKTTRAVAGYLNDCHTLSEAERQDLTTYWLCHGEWERDGRRRSTLAKLVNRVQAVLAREQVVVCPVVFTARDFEVESA